MAALGSLSPFLSAAEYDAREKAARVSASYPALRSFAPVSFNAVGFPTNVAVDSELRRYVDIMGETADRELWRKSLICSGREKDLVLDLRDEIERACEAMFDRKIQPFMSLLTCFPIVRFVDAVSANAGRKLRILEIGPGSGGLGAYLLKLGHTYFGVEVTQALYLWQHRLFNWIAKGDFQEYALRDAMARGGPTSRAAMIPWWHFAEFFRAPPLGVDIVICDAALGEMDPFAARHAIRLSKSLLADSDVGLFVYQHLGEQRQNNDAFIENYLRFNRYKSFGCGPVKAHMANATGPQAFLSSLSAGAPPIGGGDMAVPVGDFLKFDPERAAESYAFFDFLDIHRESVAPPDAPAERQRPQQADVAPAAVTSRQSGAGVPIAAYFENRLFVLVYACDLIGIAVAAIVARFVTQAGGVHALGVAQIVTTFVAIAAVLLPLFQVYSGRERLASAAGLIGLLLAISASVLFGLFVVHGLGFAGGVEPALPAAVIVIAGVILSGARVALRSLRG